MTKWPPVSLLVIGTLFLLSNFWGGDVAYTTSWVLTVWTITSLKIDWRSQTFYFPIVFVLLAGIPYSIFLLTIGVSTQGQGLAGNASFYAGQLVITSLIVPQPFSTILGITTGLTGARVALGILLIFSNWKTKIAVISVGGLVSLSLWLGTGWTPYQRLTMSELGPSWRIEQAQGSWIRTNWWGTGMFNEETISLEHNPHNIYQIILEGLGWPLGIVVIGMLAWNLRNRAGLALLTMGIFDQFWLTTYQGLLLLSVVMAMRGELWAGKTNTSGGTEYLTTLGLLNFPTFLKKQLTKKTA